MMNPYYEDDLVRLYCGDSREVLPSIPAGSVNAVVTDPDYDSYLNVAVCDFGGWPDREIWQLVGQVIARPGYLAWCDAPHLTYLHAPRVIEATGFDVLEVRCWIYGSGRPVSVNRLKRCWDIVHFMAQGTRRLYIENARLAHRRNTFTGRTGTMKPSPKFGSQFGACKKRRPYESGADIPYFPANVACDEGEDVSGTGYETIFGVKRTRGGGLNRHPTEKPVDLMAQIIRLTALRGQTVLDPFAGSGTTLVAAKALGVKSIGIERNEKFCECAASRLSQGVLACTGEAE